MPSVCTCQKSLKTNEKVNSKLRNRFTTHRIDLAFKGLCDSVREKIENGKAHAAAHRRADVLRIWFYRPRTHERGPRDPPGGGVVAAFSGRPRSGSRRVPCPVAPPGGAAVREPGRGLPAEAPSRPPGSGLVRGSGQGEPSAKGVPTACRPAAGTGVCGDPTALQAWVGGWTRCSQFPVNSQSAGHMGSGLGLPGRVPKSPVSLSSQVQQPD